MNEIFEDLKEKMRNGETQFTYIKKDGTTRKARGTVNLDIIPTEQHPKGELTHCPVSDVSYRYFDLDKNGWRSFTVENLVSVA